MSIQAIANTTPVQVAATQPVKPAEKKPEANKAAKMTQDIVQTQEHKSGFVNGLLTFGGGTLAGAAAGAATGAVAGRIIAGSNYGTTGIAMGVVLGGAAGGATGLAVNSLGAARGKHSMAWGIGAGAAVGALSSVALPALMGGGKAAFNPLFAGIFSVIGAASGAAAAYTAIKANP